MFNRSETLLCDSLSKTMYQTMYHLIAKDKVAEQHISRQAISARERALCQLTVCFEFQSRSDRRKKHKSCALEMVFGRKLRR